MFQRAESVLGYDLAAMCAHGQFDRLSRTEYTQPALYVTSCAALEAARERHSLAAPVAVAGHSVGEYAALYAAGAFAFEEGLGLVQRRGMLMSEAAARRPGSMAAVLGLELGSVESCCEAASSAGIVTVANDNCPGQVVIAGEVGAVEAACSLARAHGAKRVVPLPVSGGFHSALVADVADKLGQALAAAVLHDAHTPVISNVAAEPVLRASEIRENLQAQVVGRVRWRESMKHLVGCGISLCIELGSGDVLTGLMRRIDPRVTAVAAHDTSSLARAMEAAAAY
jgi:[acyl-carrier-protein] S-malonyltransferase